VKHCEATRRDVGWRGRLAAVALGVVLGLYGFTKIKQGRPIYENYRGQDVNAMFVVALGGLAFVFAVFPWGLFGFLWDGEPAKRRFGWYSRRNRPRKLP